MQITVKTFAQTREITGEDNIVLSLSENSTIENAIMQLETRSDKWALALEGSVLTARNQELCDIKTVLSDGDELALFPPVTGG
ncbi:molybdopterin synthase sulfur carrier subunit [Alteromonas sp. V450]|uniref:MoaD/ThiS family protein n=1 Tax=Alteromonas sp. V450 TaxID=1912139 RepID=UPI0008FF1122|nr:MoaD/ThiS family protein [Alteromonas sp. V450]OJF68361.1 molybdopterin synthase sulfur carrier subunit [Alteromonas sp. V450]|tara:strand:- start:304 stop:552 length:249 start_codon:yes stop_codon:yes gene_type:complete